jgi:monoamine oxidase
MTRRRFLELLGLCGGAASVHHALGILGLLPKTAAAASLFNLSNTGSTRQKRILVLGAGLAGLCAGYELSKLGYDCRILEARPTPGGRCLTVRKGFTQAEIDGKEQTAHFDDDLYFNPGPTRIPQDHLTLDYCRELGVAIELFGNVNDAAYRFSSGKRTRLREAHPGSSSYIAELLAKVSNQDQLDKPLSREERDALLELLRGGGAGGDPKMRELVMFQIAGGVDRLPRAFADRLGADIEYGAKVTEIRQRDNQVHAYYSDRLGRMREATADLCACTIPPPVLRSIAADFATQTRRAIEAVQLTASTKIGLQFKRRFWEEDDKIFGGISQTDDCITQILYPSCGWLGKKGVIVGCYNYGENARELGELPFDQRIERALTEGEKLHPQYRKDFETGFSMPWHRIPFTLGAWSAEGRAGRALQKPDGRVHFAGEHVAGMGGWMAGALESGRAVTEAIHARVQKE